MIANKKARLMKDAPEAIMHMIDSKWNHLKGVGLREQYSRSTCLKHQKSAPGVDALWRYCRQQHFLIYFIVLKMPPKTV